MRRPQLTFPHTRPIRLALLACVLLAALPASGQTLLGGQTTLGFDAQILSDLGIALEDVTTSAPPSRPAGLGFAVSAQDSLARFAPGGDFERFSEVSLQHAGGFTLVVQGRILAFAGAPLALAGAPHLLELRDTSGQPWLSVGSPHAQLSPDGRVLVIENADLLATPALAALLGRPELAGSYLGVLDATLLLEPEPGHAPEADDDCIPDIGDPVDVELAALYGLTQAAREAGGRVSMAPSAELRNNGPGDVAWNRAIAPDSPVGPHPYLALHMYRLSGGVLEQIGRADLKHAFFATNTGCPCAGGHVLFSGCEDLYGMNTNLNQTYLGPRSEIDALDRSWTSLGSHFDGAPVDDVRSHFGSPDHDSFEHRLVVQEPDLETPGASYFMEAWYLAPLDTNLLNSLGHREVTPGFAGSTWAFPSAAPMQLGSILDVWVDPLNPAPGEQSSLVDTGQGRVQLAVAATSLGGGIHHYEWALQNFDFEGRLESFSVPVTAQMNVTNLGFGDGDGSPANDWTPTLAPNLVTWSAPAGNELDWGRLYNFRMDVDAGPVSSEAQMQPLVAGPVVSVPTLAPAGVANIPALPWPLLAPTLGVAGLMALRRSRPRR